MVGTQRSMMENENEPDYGSGFHFLSRSIWDEVPFIGDRYFVR